MRSRSIIKEQVAKLRQSSQTDMFFGNNCKRSGNEKVRRASGYYIKRK